MADALAVYHPGLRSAARDHDESIQLLFSLNLDRSDLRRNAKHLTDLLDVKSVEEYEERRLTADDAEAAITKSKRFRDWAKTKLPK